MVKEFTRAVLENSGIVFVKFGSKMCSPCRKYKPIFEEFSVTEEVDCYDCDLTNDNIDIALELDVRALPTTIIFKDGEEVERLNGLQSLDDLEKSLNQL